MEKIFFCWKKKITRDDKERKCFYMQAKNMRIMELRVMLCSTMSKWSILSQAMNWAHFSIETEFCDSVAAPMSLDFVLKLTISQSKVSFYHLLTMIRFFCSFFAIHCCFFSFNFQCSGYFPFQAKVKRQMWHSVMPLALLISIWHNHELKHSYRGAIDI